MSCNDIEQFIVPTLNDIYNPARIVFQLKHCALTLAEDYRGMCLTITTYRKSKNFSTAPLYDPQALNIFIVPVISDGTNGYQVRCADSYIVMAETHPYNCTKRTRSKFSTILAHEIGHDFGLNPHHNDNDNLMFPYRPTGRALTQIQVRRMS